ncbi:sensor domain-containing diguanylate cyclase, partial [Caballeronia sp. BR00000012568055]|uniref:GGDEF domain-containing protein n=1 Tax=Caballeronia sp. BR00000012568055 TaxID=2918761 RepID=UPI0023F900A7
MDRHATQVAVGATLASVLILIATVMVLASGRNDTITRARHTSANVSVALSQDIARNIEIYNLSLQAVAEGMVEPSVLSLSPELRRQVLFDRSATAAYIDGIYAVNEHGQIVDGRGRELGNIDLSDRDFFRVHQNSGDADLFISKPYLSNARSGIPLIALSRRITQADGSFGGIALIVINLGYFQQLVDDIKLGPQGAATILQVDGFIIARNPRPRPTDITNISDSPTFQKLLDSPTGSYESKSPVDGVEKIATFSHVRASNLIVVVAPAVDDVTMEWKHRSLIIGGLVILVAGAFAAVVWLLVGAVRQRDAAHARLIEIAETDGLTGVANRRRLDSSLDALWAKAAVSDTEVALLFVDADHFKRYNDSHGHEAGDRALQFIAECLQKHARNPGDVVARYGGEEFIVGLANTSERSAAEV